VYWEVRASEGWCASFPHSGDELYQLLESCVDKTAGVEVVATSHGLYGDSLGLRFFGAALTKRERERFVALIAPDCEFWRMKELQVKDLQRLGQAPLFRVNVAGSMKFVTLLEAYKLFSEKHISEDDIGPYVLESDLSCREISHLEKLLIIETEPD
jgi:hypothetical protein